MIRRTYDELYIIFSKFLTETKMYIIIKRKKLSNKILST